MPWTDIIPGSRVVTLPRLEQITVTTDLEPLAPLTIPILPALCLPRTHRVSIRSARTRGSSGAPILPLSFEERLPALSATPLVSVTLSNKFKLKFFGPGRPELTLSVGLRMGFTFTQSTFGGTPFGSVRKLHACFPTHSMGSASFIAMLRPMRELERLEMEIATGPPLTYWAEADDQAGICPALMTLTVTVFYIGEAVPCVQKLEQARKRASVPIACVEIREVAEP